MSLVANTEYEAGFNLVACRTPDEVTRYLRHNREIVCALLSIDPDQDQRSNYELWGAHKQDGRPQRPASEKPLEVIRRV